MNRSRIALAYQPPLEWSHLLGHFKSHLVAGIESVSDDAYERLFEVGGATAVARVTHDADRSKLRVTVIGGAAGAATALRARITRMFDLDHDPLALAKRFKSHAVFRSIHRRQPGLRIGRGWDPFETAVSTILGQLVSVKQAKALLRQLIEAHGRRVVHPITGGDARLFPSAAELADADLATVRTSPARKAAIRAVAALVARGELDLVSHPPDIAGLRRQLLQIRGIGPWSAEYIALRALGDTDAFPRTDLFIQRALQQHPGIDLESLRPYRGYAAIHLWKHYGRLLSKQKVPNQRRAGVRRAT